MPRSGFAGAVTVIPAAWRRSTTPFQLDASAKAPCTRTTVRGALSGIVWGMGAPDRGRSVGVDVENRLSEGVGSLLRKVVAAPAVDGPVLVPAGELAGVRTRVGMRGAVGVPFEG